MTFTLDPQVAAVLAAAFERSGPPPAVPVGDVASRRVALDAMLGYFNNEAQPVAGKVDISDQCRHARQGRAARAVVPPAVERERGGGAVLAWRRDDRRLGADLRRAGLPVGTRRYQVSPDAVRTMVALLTLRDHVIAPILAGVRSPRRGRPLARWTRVDRDYQTLRIGM